jgi:hypothetical protein
MSHRCEHAADIRNVTPSALLRGMFENQLTLGSSAPLPHLRSCRLLR